MMLTPMDTAVAIGADAETKSEKGGVLQRLKAATRAEHDAIEVALDLMAPGSAWPTTTAACGATSAFTHPSSR
jgi:hypothetical protein